MVHYEKLSRVKLKKHCLLLALLGFSLLLTTACSSDASAENGDKKVETEEKDERVLVESVAIERGSIESTVRSSTNLEAEEKVEVFARASNRSTELLVEEGDKIVKGQVLLRLEDDAQKIDVAKARAQVQKAEKEFARTNDLYKKELVTVQEYNDKSYNLGQRQLELDQAEQNLAYTVVIAPISGTVTQRMVNLGDMVQTGRALFEIVNFDSIVARVYLPEKNLAQLKLGQAARLSSKALLGTHFEGGVKRIAPTVDARTGTVKVTVSVDQIGALCPGMYVDVELVMAIHDDAVLIPKRALVYDNDQVFVFRVVRGADKVTAERVPVEILLTDRDFVESASGVAFGDEIVIAGHTGLKAGSEIRVLGDEDTQSKSKNSDTVEVAER